MRVFGRNLSVANAMPVVARELRAESRRPLNHGLRVLAAGVVVTVFVMVAGFSQVDASLLGVVLFRELYLALYWATWIIVPMMTADCISFEKREGTLGLLFLTPLTKLDVIMGKAATHVLRATTLLLASLPVLVLPFTVGGVAWQSAVAATAYLANALMLGIAAGIYASAKGGSAIQVMVMAEGYALVFGIISWIGQRMLEFLIGRPLGVWSWLAISVGVPVILFSAAIAASVRLLRNTWDQDAAAPERPKWVRIFSGSEFWRGVFHWNRGRALDRNPMAWLQEYSWTARLTKWGWFLAVLAAEFLMVAGMPGWQPELTMALGLGVAFSATGSFRRERQSGLLEVLLVTPISVRQIVAGRLWGIFSHFSPALLVLILGWYAERELNPRMFSRDLAFLWPDPLAFVALMVVGLYLSLWRLNFLVVWMLTWLLAFLLPALAADALGRNGGMTAGLATFWHLGLASACWFLLCRNMEQRRFLRATGS